MNKLQRRINYDKEMQILMHNFMFGKKDRIDITSENILQRIIREIVRDEMKKFDQIDRWVFYRELAERKEKELLECQKLMKKAKK